VCFVFDEGHWPLLAAAAEERNLSVARLCRFTLEIISREGLWDAIHDRWTVPASPHRRA